MIYDLVSCLAQRVRHILKSVIFSCSDMVAISVAPEIPVSNLIPVERKHRRVRYCFPFCRTLFHRRRQRKIDTESRRKIVEVVECQQQDITKAQEFIQKEPSEWHLPTDWALEIKELPKV
jgi:hypothetical protein